MDKAKKIIGDVWEWFKGKKRLIAIGAGLLAQVVPKHTAMGQGADFLSHNLDNIQIGLDVVAGLFGITAVTEHAYDKYKNIKGLRKNDNSEQSSNSESK